ncbi:hypothetical protein ACE6H2_009455 [Prunus campanulata]
MAVPLFNLAPILPTLSLILWLSLSSSNINSFFARTKTFGKQNTFPASTKLSRPASLQKCIQWFSEPRLRGGARSVVLATKVTGPSGQMTWIRDDRKCLHAKNIIEAIDGSLRRLQTDYIGLIGFYVPMFGEIEYDPTRKFSSIPIDEQLDALGRPVDSGEIRYVGLSNETPYGVMKFVQVAARHPKIVSV